MVGVDLALGSPVDMVEVCNIQCSSQEVAEVYGRMCMGVQGSKRAIPNSPWANEGSPRGNNPTRGSGDAPATVVNRRAAPMVVFLSAPRPNPRPPFGTTS